MKILHLNTTDIEGGAARGAYWLHNALTANGIDSRMLVSTKKSDDITVYAPQHRLEKLINLFRPMLDNLPLALYGSKKKDWFSPAWLPDQLYKKISKIDPHIINLHWIGEGFMRIETIAKLKRPLVWTLRDMWAMTGGCHYDSNCGRYENACGRCPLLGSDKQNDLSNRIWERKRRAWENVDLTFVAISQWLADCAKNSSLFHNRRIEVIHNALDEKLFKPSESDTARKILNIPTRKEIILYIAFNPFTDTRKGGHYFGQAIMDLSSGGWGNKAEVIVAGSLEPTSAPPLGMPVTYMGKLHDNVTLALLYSAADVTVIPSTQEAFGKTAMESLACGTPVVSFDSTGLKDIVDHEVNGYRANCFDYKDMARGIAWILEDGNRKKLLSQRGRKKVEQEFTLSVQVEKYKALYEDILCSKKSYC